MKKDEIGDRLKILGIDYEDEEALVKALEEIDIVSNDLQRISEFINPDSAERQFNSIQTKPSNRDRRARQIPGKLYLRTFPENYRHRSRCESFVLS